VNQLPAKRLSLLSWKELMMKQDRNLRECTGIPGRVNMHGFYIHSSSSDSSGGQKNKRKIDDESGTTCDDCKKKIRNTK
jgi:hypothetical protein